MGCHSSKNADARAVSGSFVSDEAPAASPYGVNFSLSLMNITVDKAAKEKYANVAAGYKLTTLKLWSWNDTDLLDALSSAYTAAGLKKLEVMIMVPQDEVIAFADSAEKAKELLPILSRYHFVRSIAVGNEPDLPGGNPPQGKDLDIFQKLPIWQSLMCKLRCKAPRQALALWSRCPSPMVWWGQTMVTGVT